MFAFVRQSAIKRSDYSTTKHLIMKIDGFKFTASSSGGIYKGIGKNKGLLIEFDKSPVICDFSTGDYCIYSKRYDNLQLMQEAIQRFAASAVAASASL